MANLCGNLKATFGGNCDSKLKERKGKKGKELYLSV